MKKFHENPQAVPFSLMITSLDFHITIQMGQLNYVVIIVENVFFWEKTKIYPGRTVYTDQHYLPS